MAAGCGRRFDGSAGVAQSLDAGSAAGGEVGGRGTGVVCRVAGVDGLAECAQAADEQQELADRRFLLHRGEALGGLQHRGARGVLRVVGGQRGAVGADHLGLRDDVERSAGVDHHVDVRERLKAAAEAGLGAPDALRDGPDAAVMPGEQRDDAVRLAKLLRPQHDPVVPVSLHASLSRTPPTTPASRRRAGRGGATEEAARRADRTRASPGSLTGIAGHFDPVRIAACRDRRLITEIRITTETFSPKSGRKFPSG